MQPLHAATMIALYMAIVVCVWPFSFIFFIHLLVELYSILILHDQFQIPYSVQSKLPRNAGLPHSLPELGSVPLGVIHLELA